MTDNEQVIVSVSNLHNREWLSNLLRRAKMTPFRSATAFAALNLVLVSSLTLYFGTWLPTTTGKGLLKDPAAIGFYLLVQPAVIGSFSWLQKGGQQLFEDLLESGIVTPDNRIHSEIEKYRGRLQNPQVPRLALILSILFLIWQITIFTYYPPSTGWITAHQANLYVHTLVDAIAAYALIFVIFDVAVLVITLNNILANCEIEVKPLSPDKAGGLGTIGRFLANLGYLIGALGITLSIAAIQNPSGLVGLKDYTLAIMLGLYVIISPMVFFAPLWTAHLAMVAFRKRVLSELSDEFDEYLRRIQDYQGNRNKDNAVAFERIQKIRESWLIADDFPVWPFNIESVRKFFSLVFTPLIPAFISVLVKWISNLI